MKKLEHLSEIYSSYDTFIIDLWGVMHNGITVYKIEIDEEKRGKGSTMEEREGSDEQLRRCHFSKI